MINCGGSILVSPIPGDFSFDGRGCYPLFCCRDWSRLEKDLKEVSGELVSLVFVADPFGEYEEELLKGCFPDLVIPYKEHFVVDLALPFEDSLSGHHARNVRKALKLVDVEYCREPDEFADEFIMLYAELKKRHKIQGIAAFSKDSLRKQLRVPGLKMFRGVEKKETVGIILFYVQDDVAYYHLGVYSEKGYETRASYALFANALGYFATRLRWVNLGAGAGVYCDGNDGLTRFKKGWATGSRTAFICGRIFNRALYDDLCRRRGIVGDDFFPLYRKGQIW